VELPADPLSGRPRPDQALSEDEIAREMIERISREVDLESGVVPRRSEPEPAPGTDAQDETETEADPEEEPVPEAETPPDEEPTERSEEDVMRELVELIAQEVDEERRG
jgi:hypothetical protein